MSLLGKQLQFGQFRVDVEGRRLLRGGMALPLTGKTFDLLLYMAENPRRPLLKKELVDAIWPDSYVEESNLTQNVFVLRKALGEAGRDVIQTLPGRGYRFSAEVTEVPSATSPVRDTSASEPATFVDTLETTETRLVYVEETEERVPIWRSPVPLTIAIAAVLLLAVAGWLGWQRWEDHVGGPPVQVVMTDIEGGTGDAVLDRTLNSTLRIELTQSPFVTVVSASTVRRTLQQMMHKPNDPVTVAIAQDICERTASQAVLHGTIARDGSGYLIGEEATNCMDGVVLASSSQQVSRSEDLPSAIQQLGASVRHGLGESRRSIARFNKPLLPASTQSLEALKDYSEASYLGQLGRFPEAIDLLKHAISIDPQFATAYLDLGNFALNTLDEAEARTYLQKAYELRDQATEPVRLYIIAQYHTQVTGDLYESLRNFQTWVNLYPRSAQPWSGLTEVYHRLGRAADQLTAAQRTKDLAPNNAVVYQALAEAQIKNADFAAALSTCRLAISRGYDGDSTRHILLMLGHVMHDSALIAAQETWGKAHPDSPILLANEAHFAQIEGRFADADKLTTQMSDAFRRQGNPAAGLSIRQGMAAGYAEMGAPDFAHKLLHSAPVDATDYMQMLALIDTGDSATATSLLQTQTASRPDATLWKLRYGPLLRGELAIVAHRPQEAVSAMEPSRALDGRDADGFYLHGKGYAQAGQWNQAETEFRAVLAHPELDPTSYEIPLSQLQLARVLALEGKRSSAINAYMSLLSYWEHADGELAILRNVHRELTALQSTKPTDLKD